MNWYIRFLIVTLYFALVAYAADLEEPQRRSKRQYFMDGYYGGFYGYTAYRIIGVIIGILLLCLCCFLPCICLAGIWFAGWFGLRNRGKRRTRAETPPRVVIQNTAPAPSYVTTRETRDSREPVRDGRNEEIVYQVRQSERYFAGDDSPRNYDRYERHKTSRL